MQVIVARLRALLAAATPGPWGTWGHEEESGAESHGVYGPLQKRADEDGTFNLPVPGSEPDAALIAESRNALADLLTVVEAVAAKDLTDGGACPECGYQIDPPPYLHKVMHGTNCPWELARKLTGGAT
jgi:hypothetical protein